MKQRKQKNIKAMSDIRWVETGSPNSIRLGSIEELIAAKASGSAIDRATSNWLAKIGQPVHDKLSNAGLVEQRASSMLTEVHDGIHF